MRALIRAASWTLPTARTLAAELIASAERPRARRELLRAMQDQDPEVRKRAADVARRITEIECAFFEKVNAELAWILAETAPGESRTRWHLGLVVARTARTRAEIGRATELMWRLAQDASNVVRCSAVEGLGMLALRDSTIRDHVLEYLKDTLHAGTPAMKCRAREALRRLEKRRLEEQCAGT